MEGHCGYLSSELWQCIFSGLGDEDLKAVSLVCKDFWAYSNPLKQSLKVVHPNITMLSRHLSRFARLKQIDLLHFGGNAKEAIGEIERSGICLESLDISMHKLFEEPRESVRLLRGLAPNLKALNCRFRVPFDDGTLEVIADTFPSLEQLRINARFTSNPPLIGLGFEGSKLKLLKKIYLYSCNVGDQFVIALSLNCVLLKDVTISCSHYLTETGIGHLLRNRPNLEGLYLYAVRPASSSINIENSISHAKALTSLMLWGLSDTDEVLKAIAKAKLGLNNLWLIACRGLTASGLLVVLSNPQLTKLSLDRLADFTDEDIKLLVLNGNVSNLTYLEFNVGQVTSSTLSLLSARCPSLVDIRVTAAARYEPVELDIPLPKNHKVRSFRLNLQQSRCNDDELLKQLGLLFPSLKVLHLSNCLEVTSIGIEAILKSCKQITELNLYGYNKALIFEANDPELLELNLEVLALFSSSIDDKGLAAIAKKFPRLLSLDLSYCTYITIEGIKQVVQNIKTLTSLKLMNWNNHRKSYGALLEWMLSTGNLASLHKIFLRNTDFITEEQRDKFLHHGCLLEACCDI